MDITGDDEDDEVGEDIVVACMEIGVVQASYSDEAVVPRGGDYWRFGWFKW